MNTQIQPKPTLEELWNLFPPNGLGPPPRWQAVDGSSIPDPYRDLLVHRRHMTMALKGHHAAEVLLRVLAKRCEGDLYARRSVLTTPAGTPILLATVRIDLAATPPRVRESILSETAPLGAILKAEKVMRRIDPYAYLEIEPTPGMGQLFEIRKPQIIYGRLATIQCGKVPAIQLLEIAAP